MGDEDYYAGPMCRFCERSQDDCDCQDKCPTCGGEMDPLDASICVGCDSYYGDCDCKRKHEV